MHTGVLCKFMYILIGGENLSYYNFVLVDPHGRECGGWGIHSKYIHSIGSSKIVSKLNFNFYYPFLLLLSFRAYCMSIHI